MEVNLETNMRKKVLDAAIGCVCQDREGQYGSPENSFNEIAKLWSVWLSMKVTAKDVAIMMALLKVARIKTGHFKEDSYIDACGYLACGAEIQKMDDDKDKYFPFVKNEHQAITIKKG